MAVKLRLKRMGAKKKPFYRIVAADARSPRDGRFIELIGTYDPIKNPAEIKIDETLALKWLNNGAIPTDTVRSLFKTIGVNQKFHDLKMKSKSKKPKKENTATKKPASKKTTTKKVTTTSEKTTSKKTTSKKTTTASKKTTAKKESK